MSDRMTPTLEQLRVFLTIAEVGSFAAAGRQLCRATSNISYTIANLERQLGLALFDRKTTRSAQLTEAGRGLLPDARNVTHSIDALRAKVNDLIGGMESEVSIVVSPLMPSERLVDAIGAFRRHFPSVTLCLSVEDPGGIQQYVADYQATIGICVEKLSLNDNPFERVVLGHVDLLPIVASSHQLVTSDGVTSESLRQHVQLVTADIPTAQDDDECALSSNQIWQLSDLSAKMDLLRAGLGWGKMPAHMVKADLASGQLVELHRPEMQRQRLPLTAIYRTDRPPGLAGRWLIAQFLKQEQTPMALG